MHIKKQASLKNVLYRCYFIFHKRSLCKCLSHLELMLVHELVTVLSLTPMHSTELPAVVWPHGATNLPSGIA